MSHREIIHLLIVDDDEEFRDLMARRFSQPGYQLQTCGNAAEALSLAREHDFDVAVLDMVLPGKSGVELLEKLKAEHPHCEAVMLTGQATVETAVRAMKLGAYDYLTKPVPFAELEIVIEKAHEKRRLRLENQQLKAWFQRSQSTVQMIGETPAMREICRMIERAGPSEKAILIQGDSGTGKELVARALHACSPRADRPLVVINCAALPESLLESELFGHEKGAFTGAIASKPGLFEVADRGTLFIDEIGEMPGPLQAKLLRVLEDGTLRRLGSVKERRVNVRLLAATNRDLQQEIVANRFREDLYYRINVMSLELPPLRQRKEDIPLLVDHFLGEGWSINEAARKLLENYFWPGNVRELINAIERAKIMADGYTILPRDLPKQLRDRAKSPSLDPDADDLATLERSKIVDIMRRHDGNKTHAAQTLGIDRRRLYRLLEKYRIRKDEWLQQPR